MDIVESHGRSLFGPILSPHQGESQGPFRRNFLPLRGQNVQRTWWAIIEKRTVVRFSAPILSSRQGESQGPFSIQVAETARRVDCRGWGWRGRRCATQLLADSTPQFISVYQKATYGDEITANTLFLAKGINSGI